MNICQGRKDDCKRVIESLSMKMEGMTVVVTEMDYSTNEELRGTRLMFTKDFPHVSILALHW